MTMTVIMAALRDQEKKATDKMDQPLVVNDHLTVDSKTDPEAQRPLNAPGHYLIFRTRVLRFHNMPTICVFFTAIFVMSFGIMAGFYLYKQYARDQMQRLTTRWFTIPMEGTKQAHFTSDNVADKLINHLPLSEIDYENHLIEKFEINTQRNYEKIDVPDFRNGRQGRFIHDFSINKTGIIDIDGKCCFVMPLDREKVLPPHNMFDLLKKMYDGYYEVNTEVVRDTMRVILPPIKDYSTIGTYIAYECQDKPIYMLEKVNMNVIKRSVNKEQLYVHFAGKKFYEIDIMNIDAIHE